ncbi:tRNA (guanosine(37)-N1)-methyltransferase TrmD, partial [Butyricicoccus sp. 1XD8-22]
MNIHVLSLFPDMFTGVFGSSILKKAQEKGAVQLAVSDIRDFSDNKHKQVDDYPYGGGAGMVLKPEPMFQAVEMLTNGLEKKPRIILMC